MLDAISSVVSAVAAQSVTAKDEAQTKNTNTASKKQDAKTDKSDAKTAGFSEEFRGCGNGYYYLLINDENFIGYDID